jgi:hypothetical protein
LTLSGYAGEIKPVRNPTRIARNEYPALNIKPGGIANRPYPPDGLDFDADRPSYNAVTSSKALDFSGHDVAISDTVFCLPVLALLPNRHRTA